MERTQIISKELNAKLNTILSEVKESCLLLCIENAEKLIGKKIKTFKEGYAHQEWVDEFEVVAVTNEFEMAQKKPYENNKFANFAKYWESFMSEYELLERKNNMRLLVKNNINPLTTEVGWFPIDSENMFDYNVFFKISK